MKNWRIALLAIASAVIGGLVVFAMLRGGGDTDDPEDKPVAPAAQRVSVAGGVTTVTIDDATMQRNHIVVAPLAATQRTSGTTLPATALDVRELVDARAQLDNARALEAQARARAVAAESEYARLKTLHDDNRNISDRVLQEAAANLAAERASVDAASASARGAANAVAQKWGTQFSNAFLANESWVNDLIANRRVLVEVTSATQPPASLDLRTSSGASVSATFLAPSPRTDPRIQGRGWLYLARSGEVVPGMNLTAILGSSAVSGVLVPHDAVVWTSGRAWVYVERTTNQFAREPLDTSAPMGEGYFVGAIAPGTRAVVEGAQQLLSEEAQPKAED